MATASWPSSSRRLTLRQSRRTDTYHAVMHDFTGQLEQLLSVALLVLLGGALATGLLDHLTWRGVLGGLLLIFVVRPLAARLSMVGSVVHRSERRAIAFFGIRGIGSIYYLAVAVQAATFVDEDEVWSATGFTILASVFVHGVTATPVMKALDRRRLRRERASHLVPAPARLRRERIGKSTDHGRIRRRPPIRRRASTHD